MALEDLKRRYAQFQGLLNTPMNQAGGLLGNIPQAALLGSAIFGQGIQGRDPFSALLPAAMQTAQLQQYLTPKKEEQYEILTEEEKKQIPGLDPNKTYQKNLKTNQISQVGSGGQNINISTENVAEVPLKIRKQYLDESKEFITRNDSRNAILSNTKIDYKKRSPADDFTLVYKYYKFVDPGSVVKESEFENLEKIGSAGDKIKRIIPKFTKGTTLTQSQVKNLEKAMEREFPSYVKDQKKRESTYGKILDEGGFSKDVYLQSFLNNNYQDENLNVQDINNQNINMRGINRPTRESQMTTEELIEEYRRLKGYK